MRYDREKLLQHAAKALRRGRRGKALQLYERVLSLDDIPKRYPVDRVFTEAAGVVTRKMNFGNYLVFYQVDDDRRQVNVLAFRHGATRREV